MWGQAPVWWGWSVAGWLLIGLLCSVSSYAPSPRPPRWGIGFVVIVFLWPLAIVGSAIEIWESRLKSSAVVTDALRARDATALIFIPSWTGSLAAIVAGSIASFFLFGFFWPYWRIADMDLWMIYEGWLLADRAPQEWFDHPGYFSILLTGNWFRLLHAAGLLDAHALSTLPSSIAESERAWTAAVRAGRVLSLLLTLAYVLCFGALIRVWTKNWHLAVLATFVLAFSGGLAMNARIMRTELIASATISIAFLVLLIAAQTNFRWRPILVGVAACLTVIGVINKVQVIVLACALPLMILPFYRASATANDFWGNSRVAVGVNIALAFAAGITGLYAMDLVWTGLANAPAANRQPLLFNTFGVYQVLIGIWIVALALLFATWSGARWSETVATSLCIVIGVSTALLTLELRYHPMNAVVVVNPLEQLLFWARIGKPEGGGIAGAVTDIIQGFGIVAKTRTFFLDSSARPTIFLEWLVIAGSVAAWRAGQRKLVFQIVLLMSVVWTTDAISSLRGLKQQYFVLNDWLVIVAAVLLFTGFPALGKHKYAFQIGFLLLAVHVAVSQAEPVKHTFLTGKPLGFCVDHFVYTRQIERFSFCPPKVPGST